MFAESISNEEITQLPLLQFTGRTVIINTPNDLTDDVLAELSGASVLGFDTETRPVFKAGPRNSTALLQLSTHDLAVLVRLNTAGLPAPIVRLLESPDVIKVGAAVRDDVKGLQRIVRFKAQGFVELQAIVPRFGIAVKGLRKMAAVVLGGRVSKAQQLSNWEAETYTPAQISYAATDAWVGLLMYKRLQAENPQYVRP